MLRKSRAQYYLLSIAKYAMVASMTTHAIIPMGAKEACDLLDVSRDTLIRMIARRVIKRAHKLDGDNGAWVLDRPEIEQLAREKAGAA